MWIRSTGCRILKRDMDKKRIIIGAAGASGTPLLIEVLKTIKEDPAWESTLIMTDGAKLTASYETDLSLEEIYALADHTAEPDQIDAGPASGTYRTEGMLVVPCSMKTAAGIHSGYADNLLLRAADVTLKEGRTLVLCARETPLSAIHLRNLYELAMVPGVRIIPPMLTYYHDPESIADMTAHTAAKLLEPFGIEKRGYRRWQEACDD